MHLMHLHDAQSSGIEARGPGGDLGRASTPA